MTGPGWEAERAGLQAGEGLGERARPSAGGTKPKPLASELWGLVQAQGPPTPAWRVGACAL